jgi:hypothetical protein
MPFFSGQFRYLNPDGSVAQSGSCQIAFEAEAFKLLPGTGSPLAFDLGDIDMFSSADFELTLTLYTGKRILLSHFGKAFQNLHHDLLEAYRTRVVQCLLLQDLEEISRFDGIARLESTGEHIVGDAQIRLYRSNLAVLPLGAAGVQWRLAEIDTVRFDENNYAVVLESVGGRLTVTKLAKRTREFYDALLNAMSKVAEESAEALRRLFPFLDPDRFQQVARIMKEGQVAPLGRLTAIHPKIEQAIMKEAVDEKLRPYFETLAGLTPPGRLCTGFKFIRKEEESAASDARAVAGETTPKDEENQGRESQPPLQGAGQEPPRADEEKPILHWFFFPLAMDPAAQGPIDLVAWEATSRSGRATYLFRTVPSVRPGQPEESAECSKSTDAAIQQLNRAIVLLNFRREPIYLSDEALQIEPRYRRYAIACRKIPELRLLRAAFVGRAVHTSPQAWQQQVQELLLKAQS